VPPPTPNTAGSNTEVTGVSCYRVSRCSFQVPIITPTGRVNAALVSLVENAIGRQANLSTGTRSRLIGQVTLEAKQLGLAVPSRAILYRVLDNTDEALARDRR
jgi:hypothetical protein